MTNESKLLASLSEREREIIIKVAEGRSSKEIAELLFLSVRTVEDHRSRIMNKLGVKNAAEMVRFAISSGLYRIDS